MQKFNKIRNFSIIAHIDHGKSTLADRMLEITKTVNNRNKKDRILDTLELEQEKGITIKLQTARMKYKDHILNLIDTPGHVDFSYEVSRSLKASEGALLLIDGTKGIQAQTFTTVYKALEYDLEIIPVINKIDLDSAQIKKTKQEIIDNFGFKKEDIYLTSAKTGKGVEEILQGIIDKIPPPKITNNKLQALIFDSFYHEHKGVVVLIKLENGDLKEHDLLHVINSNLNIEPLEIGYLKPNLIPKKIIRSGEVGYIATGLKDIRKIYVGDTITLKKYTNQVKALSGYKKPKPMVYATLFPIDADDFSDLKDALEKLSLNDAALEYSKESNKALGSGFNCGFLGLLHLEITQERLEREFDLDLISTTPSVEYILSLVTDDMSKLKNINTANFDNQGLLHIKNASQFPDPVLIESIEEPFSQLEIITPDKYIGNIMELAEKHRGNYKKMEYLSSELIAGEKHVMLEYEIPTAEIIVNFFDKLKSISQGYASMDYKFIEYRTSNIIKVTILVNNNEVEALSFLSHKDVADSRARKLIEKLKDLIPKQQFKIPIQAAIGGKIIGRETIPALRKDVTAKLYGGDVTRKKKLLEKQKKGKKRLKQFGNVEIPKNVFIKLHN